MNLSEARWFIELFKNLWLSVYYCKPAPNVFACLPDHVFRLVEDYASRKIIA